MNYMLTDIFVESRNFSTILAIAVNVYYSIILGFYIHFIRIVIWQKHSFIRAFNFLAKISQMILNFKLFIVDPANNLIC